MRKLVLKNAQSPGDIVMLTAAVRDLHRAHPGEFLTDVRTPCPDVWLNNPHLTPLNEDDPDVECIDCHYPLIHQSNHTPVHFLQGFVRFLNEHLGTKSRVTDFKGPPHRRHREALVRRRRRARGPPAALLADRLRREVRLHGEVVGPRSLPAGRGLL